MRDLGLAISKQSSNAVGVFKKEIVTFLDDNKVIQMFLAKISF
jgi:hypothetical protein